MRCECCNRKFEQWELAKVNIFDGEYSGFYSCKEADACPFCKSTNIIEY